MATVCMVFSVEAGMYAVTADVVHEVITNCSGTASKVATIIDIYYLFRHENKLHEVVGLSVRRHLLYTSCISCDQSTSPTMEDQYCAAVTRFKSHFDRISLKKANAMMITD